LKLKGFSTQKTKHWLKSISRVRKLG